MKRILIVLAALVLLSTAAYAESPWTWAGKLDYVKDSSTPQFLNTWLDVVVTATDDGNGMWLWNYRVTPNGTNGEMAHGIRAFSLDLPDWVLGSITEYGSVVGNPTTTLQWAPSTTAYSIQWTAPVANNLVVNALENTNPGDFWFKTRLQPSSSTIGRAQDTGSYRGPVAAPVPEPMSIMLGTLGLGAIGGFRRLRRK